MHCENETKIQQKCGPRQIHSQNEQQQQQQQQQQ